MGSYISNLVPSMFGVRMNVPFVSFQYCDLKVFTCFYLLHLQENPDLKKIITQARSGLEFQESVLLVVVCSPQTKHLFSNLVF